jgi:hypothetical protein
MSMASDGMRFLKIKASQPLGGHDNGGSSI